MSRTPFTCLLQDHILADVQSRREMREEEDWKCPFANKVQVPDALILSYREKKKKKSRY